MQRSKLNQLIEQLAEEDRFDVVIARSVVFAEGRKRAAVVLAVFVVTALVVAAL